MKSTHERESVAQDVVIHGFDVSPFLNSDVELFEEGSGTCNIPHKILEWAIKTIPNKVDLIIFLCLVRYSLGFQRYSCEASRTYISNWTGIDVSNVRKALRSLIAMKIILRVKDGSLKHDSAVYEISILKSYFAYLEQKKAGHSETGVRLTPDPNEHRLNQPQNRSQFNPRSGINLTPNKERINKEEKKTLIPESLAILP